MAAYLLMACLPLQDVVDHLESTRQRLTAEQLKEALQHDVTSNEELRHQLQLNPKITVHADGQYEYKV